MRLEDTEPAMSLAGLEPSVIISADLEQIAYHEAGHAVACCLVRQRFTELSIIPNEDSEGHVSPILPRADFYNEVEVSMVGNPRARVKVENKVMTLLAGMAVTCCLDPNEKLDEDSPDFTHALDFVSQISGDDPGEDSEEARAYLDWLWLRTKREMRYGPHWEYVVAVSKTLLEKKTLNYRQTHSIIRAVQQASLERVEAKNIIPSKGVVR
jgi:hypothetical protein